MTGVETGAGRGARRTMRKSEFAEHIGVSKGRVSQYISEGKLAGPALVPGPKGDLVDVEEALRQLDMRLDPVQRTAQPTASVVPSSTDPDIARWNKARADGAETKSERDRAELLESNGTWLDAAKTRRTWSRDLAELMSLIESEFPTMAEALSRVSKGDVRAMVVALRQQTRAMRTRLAARFRDVAASLPEHDE